MSDIAKIIDSIIDAGAKPVLKQLGFKNRKRSYRHDRAESVAVIDFQASQFNGGTQGRFTINVGIHFPTIAERLRCPDLPTWPKAVNTVENLRIGKIMPEGCDHWWTIDTESDNTQVALDVKRAVQQHALTWLTKVETEAGFLDWCRKQASYDAARILAAVDDRPSAKICLETLLKGSPQDWGRIEEFAHQLGIDIA